MDETHPRALASEAPSGAQEVVIPGQDGLPLSGTLVRPPSAPAMLLLQGSGPVDRDGNISGVFETDLEKQIAEALAGAGVVTLRYDKRGVDANAGEMPKDPGALADFVDWDNFVGDAVAAWRFLRSQPGIDPQRVGIFGHSEGGLIALAAARQLLDAGETPAALVLASTPGRPVSEVLHQQIARILKQEGLKPGKAGQILETADQIQQEVSETGRIPEDVPKALHPLYRPELGQYWQSFMRINPAQLAELFPGPVLVVEGTADTQVSARDDALTLDAALSKRPEDDHDLLIVARVDHELKPTGAAGGRADAGPVKPSLVKDVTAWVREKLTGTKPPAEA